MRIIKILFFVGFVFSAQISAQNSKSANTQEQSIQPSDPVAGITIELAKVSSLLQTFNKNFKSFLDTLPQGIKFSDKQQNFLLAFEILNRAELRVQILQKSQIELTEKQGEIRLRLARAEEDDTNESLDRGVAFLGTTKTEEIRTNRRKNLEAEKSSLRQLFSQVSQNVAENDNELQQAVSFVRRLRSKILPQIEQEFSDLR